MVVFTVSAPCSLLNNGIHPKDDTVKQPRPPSMSTLPQKPQFLQKKVLSIKIWIGITKENLEKLSKENRTYFHKVLLNNVLLLITSHTQTNKHLQTLTSHFSVVSRTSMLLNC